MNLLLVDDEKLLVKGLAASLRKEGFQVFAAFDGKEALEILKTEKIDLVLLDIMLPVMDGITVLKKIRETMSIPIIMLTAKDDYADMVLGLELGADDYVTKPFHTRVLVARIHSLARRANLMQAGIDIVEHGIIHAGKMKIDLNRRTLHKEGKEIDLTAKEFDILHTLARNNEIVLSREKIFDLVWQELDCDTRTVDVHISKLREKIEDDAAHPSYIRTKWGVGYYFMKGGAG
jgi:two-component system, OmpR family, response regulator VicR